MSIVKPTLIRQPASVSSDLFLDGGQPKSIGGPAPSFTRLPSQGGGLENYRFGIWETTPGTWRREDPKAEFCHILSGEGTFTSEDGDEQQFEGGDTLFFPANTRGTWDVRETLRKVFVVMPD